MERLPNNLKFSPSESDGNFLKVSVEYRVGKKNRKLRGNQNE